MVSKSVKIPESVKKNPMIPNGMSDLNNDAPSGTASEIPRAGKYSLLSTPGGGHTGINRLGKCGYCPIRSDCPDRGKYDVNPKNSRKKIKGCNQLRTLFIHEMRGMKKFEQYLRTEIAYLQSKISMQEIRDNSQELVFSPEYMEAKRMLLGYIDRLQRHLIKQDGKTGGRGVMDLDAIDIEFVEKETTDLNKGDMYLPDVKPKTEPIKREDLPPSMQPEVKEKNNITTEYSDKNTDDVIKDSSVDDNNEIKDKQTL
jgi:hypothetical protein